MEKLSIETEPAPKVERIPESPQDKAKELISKYGKICALSLGLLGTSLQSSEAQDNSRVTGKDSIERVENRRNSQVEASRKLLRPHEYIVPDTLVTRENDTETVVLAYYINKDASPDAFAAGYNPIRILLSKLFYKDKWQEAYERWNQEQRKLDDILATVPISVDSAGKLKKILVKGNIIISEATAARADFASTLSHERIHKYMDQNLTENEKAILEDARKKIVAEFKQVVEERKQKESESVENAHLLEKAYGKDRNFNLSYAVEDEDEFYSSIMEAEHPQLLEDHLRQHYPEAYKVFMKVKSLAQGE